MLDNLTSYRGSFQELADARRVLKVTNSLRLAPLSAEDRLELEKIRSLAIRCVEAATAELIETLDALDDPDAKANGDELDGTAAEDDHGEFAAFDTGAGCPLSDLELNGDEGDYGAEVVGV
jgi:hypothetical protein